MKKIFSIVLLTSSFCLAQNAWINEIHYDNAGTDNNEFIEVVIQNSGDYTLSDFKITLYNGSSGSSYDTRTIDNFTVGNTDPNDASFIYYYYNYTDNPPHSIQNGAPDGIALSYQGILLQFLSYGGTFIAIDGDANATLSTDIGESESGTTPVGESLQLTGAGTQYSDFTWTGPTTATIGMPNSGQALPVELSSFTGYSNENSIILKWQTATEVNNYGFDIERKQGSENWSKIGFVAGSGNSNSPKSYSFTDHPTGGRSFSYRLKQIDNDGTYEYYDAITLSIEGLGKAKLLQNNPNPFNPSTEIKFYIPNDTKVKIVIYDILGREVVTLLNEEKQAGYHIIYWNGNDKKGNVAASGIYLCRLIADNYVETKKMNLLK